MSPSEPGRNALHNHGAPERKERIAPRHVGARFVSRCLSVPANAFLPPRQPWNDPRRELRQLAVPTVHYVRTSEIAEVREGVSYSRHFPIQDSDHARLRLVEDHVVDFVVAVHEGAPVQWLRALLREEVHHVVEVREFPDGFFGVGVDDGRLCFRDCPEGRDLAVEEACRFAEGFESDAFAVDAVELCERLYCILPAVCLLVGGTGWGVFGFGVCVGASFGDVQCFPLLPAHSWHRWVGEMSPV